MDWDNLINSDRFGIKKTSKASMPDNRTEFQRDYDRIIFSSPFRRLQNKTQVFPLPGHTIVHNRLTHSLEVATVGRSIAGIVANQLIKKDVVKELNFYDQIKSIVSTACLVHDMGNPPFGHSGEKAISYYFKEGKGKIFEKQLSKVLWNDLINFEGNANLLRLLTNRFSGRREGGYALTYSSLGAMIKYPWDVNYNNKKFGFFQSEKEAFLNIMEQLKIQEINNDKMFFSRHPFVFIVEAADDICYQIMDMEDGCKLGIISYEEVHNIYMNFFDENKDLEKLKRIKQTLKEVVDLNEQTAYLRAMVIGHLVEEVAKVFLDNYKNIIEGNFFEKLIDNMRDDLLDAMKNCEKQAYKKLYKHESVVKIEISGYKVIGFLLDSFINAILKPEDTYNKELLSLIPKQYLNNMEDNTYLNIRAVIDYVSGMTDGFAVDLYRRINGVDI